MNALSSARRYAISCNDRWHDKLFVLFIFLFRYYVYLCSLNKSLLDMTAIELNAMNTELWQSIGAIAESEPLMKRLTRYAKKLVKEKNDSTLMSEEEFFAKIERAEKQQGRSFASVDELDKYIRSL